MPKVSSIHCFIDSSNGRLRSFRTCGLVVTNYHVISKGSSAVVKLPDGAFYAVDGVLGSDKARDLAVIKAHGQSFRTITLGNSDAVQVGQEVVAIGSPLSLESTVSNGIVSGIRVVKEEGGKFLQITAPISHGSSGGPLFNMAGEVIGITTAGLKGGENLNFAIPINDVKQLLADASEMRGWVAAFPNEQDPNPKETQSETKPTVQQEIVPCVPGEIFVLRSGERIHPTSYQMIGDKYRLQLKGGWVDINITDVAKIEESCQK